VLNVNCGLPIGVAVAAALASGLLIGLVNGFFVLYFRMNSLIVTMGVGTFMHGVTLWLGDQQTISGVSDALVNAVIVARLLGVPLGFYYALILCALLWYALTYTTIGRRLLFVGRGREVARLSGIAVDRVRLGGFLCSGLMGAIAGVLYVGTTAAADPSSGLTFLLPAFAAAFLGATSIYPGRFNPWGTTISVYFLVTGITGLSILGVSTFVQDLFYGGALVIAVTLSQIVRGREERLA
jgi:ribose transport system permease protein